MCVCASLSIALSEAQVELRYLTLWGFPTHHQAFVVHSVRYHDISLDISCYTFVDIYLSLNDLVELRLLTLWGFPTHHQVFVVHSLRRVHRCNLKTSIYSALRLQFSFKTHTFCLVIKQNFKLRHYCLQDMF